ncbi:MAG TPA: glycosyltransferase [Candidatus Solibacter sp.]|jgi:glycosyltransferase involved in cell wall biosynthesis|nr:glycosyltransferase [Candidatus Solibacter sp.]
MIGPLQGANPAGNPNIKAAIIISTRDRANVLAGTLSSILSDSSVVPREVIVVDNGSSDSTPDVISQAAASAGIASVRGLSQPAPGKSRALNLAVAETVAPYLLFTDDDVFVDDGWADALVAPFADASVAVVGGRTLPVWPAGQAPPWLGGRIAEDLGLRDSGDAPRSLEPFDVVGVNMALRRAALRDIKGPFETSLGPVGNVKVDYEEYHLISLLAGRHRIAYAPSAIVRHRIDAARLDWHWMRRMYFQRGVGAGRHDRLAGNRLPSPWVGAAMFARSYPRAQFLRAKHAMRGGRTPEQAEAEFFALLTAGRHLEWLFGERPALCLRLASLLV